MPSTVSRRSLRSSQRTNILVTRVSHPTVDRRSISGQVSERLWATQVTAESNRRALHR